MQNYSNQVVGLIEIDEFAGTQFLENQWDQTETVRVERLDCFHETESSRCLSVSRKGLPLPQIVHADVSQLRADLRLELDGVLALIVANKTRRQDQD